MQDLDFQIFRMGEKSWGIQWKCKPSREFLQFLLAVKQQLAMVYTAEIIHTYSEILLKHIESDETSLVLEARFREIIKTTTPLGFQEHKVHQVPVCYDTVFGEDLLLLADAKKCTIKEVVEMHTAPLYTVYFMGFLPGFPYLEGLDERLYIERKSIPKQKVAKGSVAIGGKQTGIYPQDSPGGWYTIGHSPVSFFDVTRESLSPFVAGDFIKFYAIDAQEHTVIQEMVKAGVFQLESETYAK
jgi:KipI family sensor histidine kinase inhibitor